jgi:MFS family permease
MSAGVQAEPRAPGQVPVAVLAAALLFNLGQGLLRPTLPLYLQQVFAASYQMVTLIPLVFGVGKWVASLPTGYLLDRIGRQRLMVAGLLVIAVCDVASVMTSTYAVFLSVRGLAGVGWAMFGTVATTTMVNQPAPQRRGRAVSLLLMSETLGLLLGSAAGGWVYRGFGGSGPFVCEAACMLVAAVAVGQQAATPTAPRSAPSPVSHDRHLLGVVLRSPGVLLMSLSNAALIAIQTGLLVFLYPLYAAEQGGVSPETVGYLVSLSVVGRLLALWLGGSASDRWGRMRVLTPGLLAYGVLLGSLPLVTAPFWLGLWSLAIGGAAGFVAGLPTALIGDRVAPPLQGVAIGWLRTMTDSGHVLGPLVMGGLADAVHLSAPFLLAGALVSVLAWRCYRQALPERPHSALVETPLPTPDG